MIIMKCGTILNRQDLTEVNKVANSDSCGSNGRLCIYLNTAGGLLFALPFYSL